MNGPLVQISFLSFKKWLVSLSKITCRVYLRFRWRINNLNSIYKQTYFEVVSKVIKLFRNIIQKMKALQRIFLVFAFSMTLYTKVTVYAQYPGMCGPAMGKILYSLALSFHAYFWLPISHTGPNHLIRYPY